MIETTEKDDKDISSVKSSAEERFSNSAHHQQHEPETDEIDLADLFKQIWAKRRIVFYTAIATFAIGIFIAIFSAEEYEASIVLMPQNDPSSGGSSGILRQVSGLAGINLGDGGGNGNLGPYLYPEVTQSTPFYIQIMEEDMYFSTLDTTVTLSHYFARMQEETPLDFAKTYTIGLPKLILNIPTSLINSFKSKTKGSDRPQAHQDTTIVAKNSVNIDSPKINLNDQEPISLSPQQRLVISRLKGRISTNIERNGTVKVSVMMPDPLVAAHTTEIAVQYLTSYIQEYRTEKAQQNLEFIEKQYGEKKEKYNQAQKRLANFQDQNMYISTESARIELDRLRTENNLAFSLYQSLAQQLEQAKIRVQEDKPVFRVLEPIQVPSGISSPKRELIIMLSIFAGFFLGTAYIFLQVLYTNFKAKL